MQGRTVRTLKRRRQFLEELARNGNVEKACAAVGMGRSAAYAWKREDEAFSNEWNAAVERVIDTVEAKLIEQAMTDDSPAGVTSRIFLLKHQRAAVYNPGMLVRHEAMRLELERRRLEMNAPPMIEGHVVNGGDKMLNELQPITIIWMPHNHRGPSPHLPVGFDIEEWCDEHGRDEPLPYQPVKQDGSGLTMQLPSSCLCTTHDTADGLVVSLQADIGSVSPEAADDLWRRIRDYNAGLALLQRAIDPRRQGLVPPQAQPLQEPPPEPEPSDKTHSEDDDPPDEIDYSGGFGRP